MQIVMFHGHTGSYLDPAPGTANLNLCEWFARNWRSRFRRWCSPRSTRTPPSRERGIRSSAGGLPSVNVEVIPITTDDRLGIRTSWFCLKSRRDRHGRPITPRCRHPARLGRCRQSEASSGELERNLSEARAQLRSMAEEHEANVEELRASNEEVRSSNEELQSTNEELGTNQGRTAIGQRRADHTERRIENKKCRARVCQ